MFKLSFLHDRKIPIFITTMLSLFCVLNFLLHKIVNFGNVKISIPIVCFRVWTANIKYLWNEFRHSFIQALQAWKFPCFDRESLDEQSVHYTEKKSSFSLKFKYLKMACKIMILCFKINYLETVNPCSKASTICKFKVNEFLRLIKHKLNLLPQKYENRSK